MKRETRPVTAREYKIMLQTSPFEGGRGDMLKASERFRDAFAKSIEALVVPSSGKTLTGGKLEPVEAEKQVTVQFLDTKDLDLRESSHIFRVRQPIGGGPLELTFKFRHPDRFLASSGKTSGKKKFEEDIKTTHDRDLISLHSLSGKVKDVDDRTAFKTLKDIEGFFKSLKQQLADAYQPNAKLHTVGGLTAVQMVLEGPQFKIGKNAKAECGLVIWHTHGGEESKPLVVEFSFRYQDTDLGPKTEPFTGEMAQRCFAVMQVLRKEQSPLSKRVDLQGPTKTAYVYSLETKHRASLSSII